MMRVAVDVSNVPASRGYVSDLEPNDDDESNTRPMHRRDWLHECTQEDVAAIFGVTRQRIEQIETVALLKVGIAFEIEERLGPMAASPVLERLRGQSLAVFREALMNLNEKRERVMTEEKTNHDAEKSAPVEAHVEHVRRKAGVPLGHPLARCSKRLRCGQSAAPTKKVG